MDSKKDIRKKVFARRAEHTDEQIWDMSQSIAEKVVNMSAFQEAERI